ncbi:hypothetical protein DACRYDRAFT_31200, partial [Dacryopinax primogenitus]
TDPWTPDHPEHLWYQAMAHCCEYNKALDCLEFLVVQWLFEIEKLNIARTGYAMCTAIPCALQTCSQAIRTALQWHNKLAWQVYPPRLELTMEDILNLAFVADFAILHFSCQDIWSKHWVQPPVWVLISKWLLIQCTHAEVRQLNVEICRVLNWIEEEPQCWKKAINIVAGSGDHNLEAELTFCLDNWKKVHARVYSRLQELFQIPGY